MWHWSPLLVQRSFAWQTKWCQIVNQLVDLDVNVRDVLATICTTLELFSILTNSTSTQFKELITLMVSTTINHMRSIKYDYMLSNWLYNLTPKHLECHFIFQAWQCDHAQYIHVQLVQECIMWWCTFNFIMHSCGYYRQSSMSNGQWNGCIGYLNLGFPRLH